MQIQCGEFSVRWAWCINQVCFDQLIYRLAIEFGGIASQCVFVLVWGVVNVMSPDGYSYNHSAQVCGGTVISRRVASCLCNLEYRTRLFESKGKGVSDHIDGVDTTKL